MNDYFANMIFKRGNYDEVLELALFFKRTKGYSMFNSALIYCQRPGAVWFETEHGWLKKGRFLKPEATPLVILQPFAPVNFVYELEDTYGKDFMIAKDFKEKDIKEFERIDMDKLAKVLETHQIAMGFSPMGTRQDGYIELMFNPIFVTHKNKRSEKQYMLWYGLALNSAKSTAQQLLAVIHELGHLFCGHLPLTDEKPNKRKIKLDRKTLDHFSKETEAELVVKFVCARMNIKYDENEYLQFCRDNDKAPEVNLEVVITATDSVLRILNEAGIYDNLPLY